MVFFYLNVFCVNLLYEYILSFTIVNTLFLNLLLSVFISLSIYLMIDIDI